MREEQDVANGGGIREEHDQAVDANALTGGGGHAMFQGTHIVGVEVHGMVFFAPMLPLLAFAKYSSYESLIARLLFFNQ